ncbi:MAG TPA: type II toxin-antitoxin system VapC family toxin [Candidatus Limnocylindria bacterium]|nr:type II toxin-antitoxin system VapC family toxin [Candidatus Limnocylindria bacterium]
MILVDSSGWIEYLADRPLADRFAPFLEGREPMIVSAIEIHEVYKVLRRDLSEERAVEAVSAMSRATIVAVDASVALEAADLALAHGLAVADSIVYATARRHGARLVTSDADFDGLPHTEVVRSA